MSTRGYIDGCFDIMHSGHFNAIRQAKGLCDVLIVGIHSDKEIQENKALPVMKQPERYALLEHIKWIDEIIYDVPYSPQMATLERARADFCMHGTDMPVNSEGVGAYDEMRAAGRLKIVERTGGVSTTNLIGRLLTLAQHDQMLSDLAVPEGGTGVNPDEAISSLLPPTMPVTWATAQWEAERRNAVMAALKAVEAKYGVSAEDAEELRRKISDCFVSPAASLSDPAQAAPTPVGFCTSTRRIAQFASSRLPGTSDTVVYVCGHFDMLHVGHMQFLREARALGTFLLVGICDVTGSRGCDDAGSPVNFTVMNLNERVLNICACKWVDEVVMGAPKVITEGFLSSWNIHIVAQGSEHLRDHNIGAQCYETPKRMGIHRAVQSRWPDLCRETVFRRVVEERDLYVKRNMSRPSLN